MTFIEMITTMTHKDRGYRDAWERPNKRVRLSEPEAGGGLSPILLWDSSRYFPATLTIKDYAAKDWELEDEHANK